MYISVNNENRHLYRFCHIKNISCRLEVRFSSDLSQLVLNLTIGIYALRGRVVK